MKKEFVIYQDKKGNVYTLTTELEQLLLEDLVEIYSIIEEVREKLLCYGETFDSKIHQEMQKELLEIIDKENM